MIPKESQGIPRNPKESKGTQRNPKEPKGTQRYPKKPKGNPNNHDQFEMTPSPWEKANHRPASGYAGR